MNQSASYPRLMAAVKDSATSKDLLHLLRHFHLGNPMAQDRLEPLAEDFLPALLAPYRNTSKLRYDYPLFLYPVGSPSGKLVAPLGAFLAELADSAFPGEAAGRMLKDNLLRLEQSLRNSLNGQDVPVDARALLSQQGEAMLAQLQLKADNQQKLADELSNLVALVPQGGQLLAYGRHPAIHLLIHSIRHDMVPREAAFFQQMEDASRGLKTLLEVEHDKSLEASSPEALRDSVGSFADRFDMAALSSVMRHAQGSVRMSPERKARVQKALATIQNFDPKTVHVRLVHQPGLDARVFSGLPNFQLVEDAEPSQVAQVIFDREAARLSDLFAALRIARLEIDDRYDSAIHDPWFASFNWEAFSPQELLLVPAVIVLESATRLAGEAMPALSRLLASGRPVQVLVRVLGHGNPGALADDEPFDEYRTELGYLGIAHRQAVVCQSSAARYEHLLSGFQKALQATRTGLHLVNVGLRADGQHLGLNAWLVAGAALEGRVHPFFQYNPGAGFGFADCMEFAGNPQPQKDWPEREFSFLDEDGSQHSINLAFTFADYALLIPKLHRHFRPVPLECDAASLLPVADYLALDETEASQYLPFVWAVNTSGQLRQLVVSRMLASACRDRLNFWRTLQEMGGVRSKYLERGIAEARAEIQAQADSKIQALQSAHAAELAEARAQAAGEVMERLTSVLMGMDFSSAAPVAKVVAPKPDSGQPAQQAPAADASEADKPQVVAEAANEAAWIDSELCTSCNDCLKVNPQMFLYNESNQAYISDPKLGTFAQLVEAAELCPSKCIHPGQPINVAEPGLEDLKQRAAKLN